MPWYDVGENPTGWAAVVSGALVFLGALFKGWFGVRRDNRLDREGQIVTGAYAEIIKQLRSQIETQREDIEKLREELHGAYARIRALENESLTCKRPIPGVN